MELLLTIAASAIGALGIGILVWLRLRRTDEGTYLVFRCPRCDQKLRYLASKAGRRGMCTRCGRNSILPTDSEAAAELPSGYRPRRTPASLANDPVAQTV